MALKGTLRDFGIADILQLIAHQGKSGVLKLREAGAEVDILFVAGNIVGAEAGNRRGPGLLGERLVRGNIITQEVLDAALELQRRTLKRLGDILVERKYVAKGDLAHVVRLQLMETVYRVFEWKSGTYEFDPLDKVEYDEQLVSPVNVEGVLMDGFRQVDEWPLILKRVPGWDCLFERTKKAPPAQNVEDEFGDTERKILALAVPGKTARDITDVAMVGEFETMRTLQRLVEAGYLVARSTRKKRGLGEAASRASALRAKFQAFVAATGKVVFYLALVAIALYLIQGANFDPSALFREQPVVSATTAQALVGKGQLERVRHAVELFKVETGCYPADIKELIERNIVGDDEIRFPWSSPYWYKRAACDSYSLFPPPF